MNDHFLASAIRQFGHYKLLGEKTFAQLPDEGLFWQPDEGSNSIGMIVQHLSGNMKSRWTNFLQEDGEKPWRNRDTEFEPQLASRESLLQAWEEGWACLFDALHSITGDDLARTIHIRKEPHLIMEAIHRQLAHYPYHVGQIVLIGKMLARENWTSLTIPRGGSDAFNAAKGMR